MLRLVAVQCFISNNLSIRREQYTKYSSNIWRMADILDIRVRRLHVLI